MHLVLHTQREDLQKPQAQLGLLSNLFSDSVFSFKYVCLKEGCDPLSQQKEMLQSSNFDYGFWFGTYKSPKRTSSRGFGVTYNHLFHFQHANLLPTKYCKITEIHQQSTENEDPNSKYSTKLFWMYFGGSSEKY